MEILTLWDRGKMYCYYCGERDSFENMICQKCFSIQRDDLVIPVSKFEMPSTFADSKKAFNNLSTLQKIVIVLALLLIGTRFLGSGGVIGSSFIFGNSVLSEPAVKYVVPGDAEVTLIQIWGVSLNNSNGAISMKDLADKTFSYVSSSVGRKISKNEVDVGFQPGNSMHSFFNRLLSTRDAINAVHERWLQLAN